MRRITIVQGEHAVGAEPGVVISTLLGSCVAVCLYDAVARIGGMNHFLLGEPAAGQRLLEWELQRYGIHAMELLINAMMRQGAVRGRLQAHVYGGANVVEGLRAIGTSNGDFALRFLEQEGIALGHSDLGGTLARRVDFMAHEGRSRCRRAAQPVPVAACPAPAGGELELF